MPQEKPSMQIELGEQGVSAAAFIGNIAAVVVVEVAKVVELVLVFAGNDAEAIGSLMTRLPGLAALTW